MASQPAMASQGWPWPAMTGHDRPWPAMTGHGIVIFDSILPFDSIDVRYFWVMGFHENRANLARPANIVDLFIFFFEKQLERIEAARRRLRPRPKRAGGRQPDRPTVHRQNESSYVFFMFLTCSSHVPYMFLCYLQHVPLSLILRVGHILSLTSGTRR